MVRQFIKDLVKRTFFSLKSIITWAGIFSFLFWWFFPKLKLGDTVNAYIESICWPYRILISLGIILVGAIWSAYSAYKKYREPQTKVYNLGELLSQIDIKQEIRTFFESVDSRILQQIDAGEKEITIYLFTLQEIGFEKLSKNPNFNKFLSFNKGSTHLLNCKPRTTYHLVLTDAFIKYIREKQI